MRKAIQQNNFLKFDYYRNLQLRRAMDRIDDTAIAALSTLGVSAEQAEENMRSFLQKLAKYEQPPEK